MEWNSKSFIKIKLKGENMAKFLDDYLKAKEEEELNSPVEEKREDNRIDTIERLKEEIEKYKNNEPADFSNVAWKKLVRDKDFTEEMVVMFQNYIQLYFKDYIDTHNASDNIIKRMYKDFLGVFMLGWLSKEAQKRIFKHKH